jgi:hypothetical protein
MRSPSDEPEALEVIRRLGAGNLSYMTALLLFISVRKEGNKKPTVVGFLLKTWRFGFRIDPNASSYVNRIT